MANRGLQGCDSLVVVILSALVVVIGGGLGGEQITGIQLLGLVIILGSVMLVNKKERINE